MTSRRFILTAGLTIAAAALTPALASARTRASSMPNATTRPYGFDSQAKMTWRPASDAASYFPDIQRFGRIFSLRSRQYQAQVSATRIRSNGVDGRRYQPAVDKLYAPYHIGLARFVLALLQAEGNAAARQLNLEDIGVELAATEAALPLVEQAAAAAQYEPKLNDEERHHGWQRRASHFGRSASYLAEWISAYQGGTPHTDYAPYLYFYLGDGEFEHAVYATLYLHPEDRPIKMIWHPNAEPVDLAEAQRLSAENKAYLDGLASIHDKPMPWLVY